MKNRTYNQFCALAFALDIIGERWTLLIIRELLTGPRRFKDLLDGLPGVSTNLLTERLKSLEEQGILCRRVLPPPAGSTVYELTPVGRGVETAVIELGRWGSQFLPPSMEGLSMPSVGTTSLAIKAFFNPQQAQDIDATYELHLDDEILQIQIRNGTLHIQQGPAFEPDAVFYTSVQPYLGMFSGQLPPEQAIAAGLIRIEGDPAELERFLSLSHVPTPSL